MGENKRPLGVTILGGINSFILGIGLLISSALFYTNLSTQNQEWLKNAVSNSGLNMDLDSSQVKIIIISQIIVSLIFAISGWGLLLKKEWARKLTLYFSFFLALLTAISVFFHPFLIRQAFPQIIYLGIIIIYFTNKDVESYFKTTGNNKSEIE